MGDPRWTGWSIDTTAIADLHDLIAALMAGLGGKELPANARFPRPGQPTPDAPAASAEPAPVAATIADFNVAGFLRRIHE